MDGLDASCGGIDQSISHVRNGHMHIHTCGHIRSIETTRMGWIPILMYSQPRGQSSTYTDLLMTLCSTSVPNSTSCNSTSPSEGRCGSETDNHPGPRGNACMAG